MAEQDASWDHCLRHYSISDIGMRRSNNQDASTVLLASDSESWAERGHLFIVADGMGAHAAGELASKLAVEGISHAYYMHRDKSPPEAILKAIRDTNLQINNRGKANTDFHNMGTTGSCLLLLPQGALAAHVGDSRVYRWRADRLEQLTFDHSLVWEMKAAGQLKGLAEEAAIPKNVITRSLGPHPTVQVDLEGPHPVQVGDVYLLCSDGLTGKVEDEEIGPILGCLDPQAASHVLVDLANLRGGPDNITVIVVKVTGNQVATGAVRADPLTVGGSAQTEPSVHLAVWIAIGVCLLATAGMLVAGQVIPAMVAGFAGLISVVVAILQKFGGFGPDREIALVGRKKLGKGPHTSINCPANMEFVKKLNGVVEELRGALSAGKWSISWSEVEEFTNHATAAAKAKDFSRAVQHYGEAISYIMRHLRTQQEAASDSSIEY